MSVAANTLDLTAMLHYLYHMKVSAQYAQEHFADILNAVDGGEEVEIARPDKPALFLVLRPSVSDETLKRPRRELFGAWEGKGLVLPTDEEWRIMDEEIEDEMLNGPLFPPDHS